MNINFEYDGVKASNRLEIMAAEKLSKLEDKYDFIIRTNVNFKTENTSSPDSGMICSIRLSAPGSSLFATASKTNFETAIPSVIIDLERQLSKRKQKMKTY